MTSIKTGKYYALLLGIIMLIGIPCVWAVPSPAPKGEIKGSVLDKKHLPISSNVYLFKDTARIAQTTTDASGDFYFSNLPDGNFHVEITYAKKTKKTAIQNISVSANKMTVLLIDIKDNQKESKVDVLIYKTAQKNPDPNFEYIDTAYKYEIPQ